MKHGAGTHSPWYSLKRTRPGSVAAHRRPASGGKRRTAAPASGELFAADHLQLAVNAIEKEIIEAEEAIANVKAMEKSLAAKRKKLDGLKAFISKA